MRLVIAVLTMVGALWITAGPARAAPVPLTGIAADPLSENAAAMVVTVSKRTRTRKTVRRGQRKCGWQCKRYYTPYQYRYWKFYYPHGGPLFSAQR